MLETTIIEKKKEFAKWLIKYPDDAFKAAAFIYPDPKELGNRLIVAHDWPRDPDVIIEISRLINSGETATLLPTKEEVAYDAYLISKTAFEADDKIKAIKLYAELMGFVKTPGVNIQNNIKTIGSQSNVMVVPDYGSDDEWEQKLLSQQSALINKEIDIPNAGNSETRISKQN